MLLHVLCIQNRCLRNTTRERPELVVFVEEIQLVSLEANVHLWACLHAEKFFYHCLCSDAIGWMVGRASWL